MDATSHSPADSLVQRGAEKTPNVELPTSNFERRRFDLTLDVQRSMLPQSDQPRLFKAGWVTFAQVQGVSAQATFGAGNTPSQIESSSGGR
jgi:hypothetical protein